MNIQWDIQQSSYVISQNWLVLEWAVVKLENKDEN